MRTQMRTGQRGRYKAVRATMKLRSRYGLRMELTAVLTHAEEGGFVALNPETGTTTQGETVEEAMANLQEATALYLRSEAQAPAGRLFWTSPKASQR